MVIRRAIELQDGHKNVSSCPGKAISVDVFVASRKRLVFTSFETLESFVHPRARRAGARVHVIGAAEEPGEIINYK